MPSRHRRPYGRMKVTRDAPLKNLNTLGLAASASRLVELECEEDILMLPGFDSRRDIMLGGGSNVVFLSDVPGTVYLLRLGGISASAGAEGRVVVDAGAGVGWHDLVTWALDQGLHGLENLALIPGTVGAAPIQNIGAYGVELASVLESVTAWDWFTASWVTLGRDDCRPGYRDSLFRSSTPYRYLITSVRLSLSRQFHPQLGYEELNKAVGDKPTARDVVEAVMRLRRAKLPDPEASGNVGSFFKNPVIGPEEAEALRTRHDDLPAWTGDDGHTKFSAGWMIEACGLKGLKQGGARVSKQHALVLVNEGGATGHDISTLSIQVQKVVFERFGIRLEPEPLLIDFAGD